MRASAATPRPPRPVASTAAIEAGSPVCGRFFSAARVLDLVACLVVAALSDFAAGEVTAVVAGLVFGLVAGLSGLVVGSVVGSVAGLVAGLVAGSVAGLVAGSVVESDAGSVVGSVVAGGVSGQTPSTLMCLVNLSTIPLLLDTRIVIVIVSPTLSVVPSGTGALQL